MPTTPEFFDELREWSYRKHKILREYLPRFANILGSRHLVMYYVDGFAGAGQYGKENPVPGSPLIAANFAWSASGNENKGFTLRCINVEPVNFSELCAATSDYCPPFVTNLKGTFKQALPTVLQQIGDAPTLFLLDPYGYDGMEWDVISRLAQRATSGGSPKTELLIYKVEADYREMKAKIEKARTPQLNMFGDLFEEEKPPTPQEQLGEIVVPMIGDVADLGARLRHTTFGEIQDKLSAKWFGLATEKHYREACRRLIHQGRVSESNTSRIDDSTFLHFINVPDAGATA